MLSRNAAVRAAIAVVEAVPRLDTIAGPPPTLCARVGIATGMVIVGNFIELAELRKLEIVGDTPELAARLQMSAEPDTVVVERTTRHLLGNHFECSDLDPIPLGLDAEPIRRWQVRGETAGVDQSLLLTRLRIKRRECVSEAKKVGATLLLRL